MAIVNNTLTLLSSTVDDDENDSDSEGEAEELVNNETFVPYRTYKHVRCNYTNTQKLLEPNHTYDWKIGVFEDLEVMNDHDVLDESILQTIRRKNARELFELFFFKRDERPHHCSYEK